MRAQTSADSRKFVLVSSIIDGAKSKREKFSTSSDLRVSANASQTPENCSRQLSSPPHSDDSLKKDRNSH